MKIDDTELVDDWEEWNRAVDELEKKDGKKYR